MIRKLFIMIFVLFFHTNTYAEITHFKTGLDYTGHHYIAEKSEKTLTAPVSPCSLFGRGTKAVPGDFKSETSSCWLIGEWSACSNGCGEGVMEKLVQCVSLSGEGSASCVQSSRPNTSIKCSDFSRCDYSWKTGTWGACGSNCGDGEKMRQIWCESTSGEVVEDVFCSAVTKPTTKEPCSDFSNCGFSWSYGEWGECNGYTWYGTRSRTATCVNYQGDSVDESLCTGQKLSSQECETTTSYARCADAYSLGASSNGYYRIEGYKTYCDMTGGGWTLIARAPAGNSEFKYDGIAWNNTPFGAIEGTGAYLSPLWNIVNTSQVRFQLPGYTVTATSSQNEPFSSLRTSGTLYNGSKKMTQGSSKLSCTWSQTVYYRFAFMDWTNNCNDLRRIYGLGLKSPQKKDTSGSFVNEPYETASALLRDGVIRHDSADQHSFSLWIK